MRKSDCDLDDAPVAALGAFLERAMALMRTDRDASARLLLQAAALLRARGPQAPRVASGSKGLPYSNLASWQIDRVLEYVERNLGTTLRAGHLAAVVHLSQSHFHRGFRSSTGITPSQYIAQRRIERACQMMQGTDQPLTQIALACGFCDQPHFTRVFRRWTGETPRAWRRARGPEMSLLPM